MEESEKSTWFSKLKGFVKKGGKIKSLIVVGLVIVILVIFASSFKSQPEKETEQTSFSQNFLALEYCDALENRLEQVLSKIKGIGSVSVFVAVESSPKYTYLEETESTSGQGETAPSSQKTSIYEVRDGNITRPVVVLEMLPKVIGVLVVASGAKDIKLRTTLINVVASTLDISLSCVEVLEGK